jgi:protocatechuate 3,4-dioxygenase beta subunit
MRVWRITAIAAVILSAEPLRIGAQSASVRGVAFDSLRGVPLRRALVTISGSSAQATTDALGRFSLDSVAPGPHIINAQHPAIDSIGLSGIAARVTVAGVETTANLAIPSFSTLWRTACGNTPVPATGGFVYGTVRDASGLAPVSDAAVDVSWIDLSATKVSVSQKRWRGQALTDSTGSYAVCGLPAADGLRMQAGSDIGVSGIVNVFPTSLRIQRRDFLLGPASDSDLTRRSTITGRVMDENGDPLTDARVLVDEFGEVRSAADGSVLLRSVPAGTRQVDVRAIGRMPVSIVLELTAGDTASFTASMRRVTTLDVVRVTGTRRQRVLVEAFEKRRTSGFGVVLDSADLSMRGRLWSAFEGFPSVEVRVRSGDFTLLFPGAQGGRCAPSIFIDGRKSDIMELNMLRIGELAAVEVYTHRMSTPAEFLTNERCGSVAVWTKFAFS